MRLRYLLLGVPTPTLVRTQSDGTLVKHEHRRQQRHPLTLSDEIAALEGADAMDDELAKMIKKGEAKTARMALS
jgi:hypothetical protein